jgi:hypothetical protein
MYLENITGGGQALLGTQAEFKINYAISSYRGRRSHQALHLTTAKPDMRIVLSPFTSAMKGTRLDEDEFRYVSNNKLLSLKNLIACSGITLHLDDTYAIPINYLEREGVVLTNVDGPPTVP